MPKPITDLLSQINAELKSAKCGVVICLRGDRLSLRGTFPPQPNSDKTRPHQQYLALDIYANPAGFKPAKSEALLVGGLLACKDFSGEDWLEPTSETPSLSKKIADLLQEFESDYFSRKVRTAKTETNPHFALQNVA